MKRALLPLMVALLPASVMAEVLPLALSGPAYQLANEAYLAYDRKDYDQAVAKAREALRQRPDANELNDLVKLALRDKERRDHPERYPKARPKPGYLAGNQSLREYRNGQYDAAANAALKAISQAPENLDYRLMLIEALQRQQKLEQAHAATTEAIATLGPQQVLVRRRQAIEEQQSVLLAAKGYEALARGDNDKAVSLARDVVQRYPQNVAYRRLLVSALIAHQQYEPARAAASEALALQGNDATLLAQRGQMRQRLGDEAGARQDYAQALAVGNLPDRERAALYAAMGQPDTALRYLQQARAKGELQPGDEVQIAYFLSQAGEPDQALATFRQVDRSSGLETCRPAQRGLHRATHRRRCPSGCLFRTGARLPARRQAGHDRTRGVRHPTFGGRPVTPLEPDQHHHLSRRQHQQRPERRAGCQQRQPAKQH